MVAVVTVLVVWIAAIVAAALLLGIVGFQLVGQVRRLMRSVAAFQRDVQPRVTELLSQLPSDTTQGRHSVSGRGPG